MNQLNGTVCVALVTTSTDEAERMLNGLQLHLALTLLEEISVAGQSPKEVIAHIEAHHAVAGETD